MNSGKLARGFVRWALLIAASTNLSGVAVAAGVPLDAYGRLPSVDKIAISPDGARIALIASGMTQQLQVRNTTDLKLISASPLGAAKVVGLDWATPEHLIIVTAMTATVVELSGPKHEWAMAAVLDLGDNKARPLLRQEQADPKSNDVRRMNTVYGMPQVQIRNGKPYAIIAGQSFPNNEGALTIFRENLDKSSTVETIATGNHETQDLLVDETGRAVARADYDSESGAWSLWTRGTDGGWRQAHKGVYKIDAPSVAGFGRDTSTVLVITEEESGRRYREVSLAKGTWSEPIEALDRANLIINSRKGTTLGGYVAERTGYRYTFFDPADQQLWDKVVKAFPGEAVRLASWSDDRTKVILQVEGAKNGAAYYLLDRTTRRAEWIADEYEAIPPEQIAEVRAISYRAGDGLEISAYLTLPRAGPAKGLPLVALVHGGPEARDYPGFDYEAQALASMGYAVLQPQFRGSTGHGLAFVEAGYGQLGRKMQTDVSDGVRYLAEQGIIDPARVCIAGSSYGGYAAMAGVTLQSGIYRCAIAVSGMSDLRRDMQYDAQRTGSTRNATRRYWLRFMGAKSAGDPVVDEISPVRHVQRLTVPLLLIHGSIDTVVEPVQSKLMLEAGQKAGKNVRLVTLKGEDHNMARSETRLQKLQAMAEFLRVHLPVAAQPQPQTASATP